MARSVGLPRAVVLLGLTSLLTDVATEMVFPLLPAFLVMLGGSAAFLGLIEGLADATSSFLKLGTGFASDKLPRKPFVVFGYGVASLIRPCVALATAPWHVLAIRLTDRVGKGIRTTPRDSIIASSVAREHAGRAFGFHQAMDHAGAVVGPLVATLLLALGVSLRTVFLATLVPGALATVATLLVREPEREQPTPAAAGVATAPVAPSVLVGLPRSFRAYLVVLALYCLGGSSDAFLILRAREAGVTLALVPLLWAAFNLSRAVSSYVGGRWSDRTSRVRLIVAGWMLYALSYLAFGLLTAPWHAWLVFSIYGLHYGLTEPVEKALVRDLAPAATRGRAFGLHNFVTGITAVPAGLLTGFLWDAYGSKVALAVGAGLAATAALGLVAWARRYDLLSAPKRA